MKLSEDSSGLIVSKNAAFPTPDESIRAISDPSYLNLGKRFCHATLVFI